MMHHTFKIAGGTFKSIHKRANRSWLSVFTTRDRKLANTAAKLRCVWVGEWMRVIVLWSFNDLCLHVCAHKYMIYERFHIEFYISVSMVLSLCGDDRSSELLGTALATNPESKSKPILSTPPYTAVNESVGGARRRGVVDPRTYVQRALIDLDAVNPNSRTTQAMAT